MKRTVAFLSVCLICLSITGCGDKNNQPRPLPLTRALDLASHKIGKVDLVVKDQDRAEKVKEILIEIEAFLLSQRKVQNTAKAKAFATMGTDVEGSTAAFDAAFAKLRAKRETMYEKYVNLQLELRKHLTESEFKKLNKVR